MEYAGFGALLKDTYNKRIFRQKNYWSLFLVCFFFPEDWHLTNLRPKKKMNLCVTVQPSFVFFYFSLWCIQGLFGAVRRWCQYSVSHTWQPSKFNWTDSALLMRDLSTGFSYYRVPVWMPGALWRSELSPQSSSSPPQSLTPITSEEQSDAQDQQQPGLFFPGSVWPPSNMFPARRRGKRTGYSTVAPRTMVTARRTGQVGQVWVSCWILLSATCILSAQAQGKMRNSGFILDT